MGNIIYSSSDLETGMHYRAVKNRCAVDFGSMDLPIDKTEALKILEEKGFKKIDVDLISLAEESVERAKWKRASRLAEAPEYFDCSAFTKWLYGQKGISIPRRPTQQLDFIHMHGSIENLTTAKPGDLLFVNSPFLHGPPSRHWKPNAGHVCLVENEEYIICATNSKFGRGVRRIETREFLSVREFVAIGRILPTDDPAITFITPHEKEVETSDDIRWIILQSL